MNKRKYLLISAILSAGFPAAAGFVWYTNAVVNAMSSKVYPLASIPERETALLLGTARKTRRGSQNLYFAARIDAAVELYQAGRIRHILVTGDNSRKDYDEPNDMKSALLQRGIPESAITLDFAGFRTLDSVVRSKQVFGHSRITVISQQGHLERAIYLAEQNGMDAIGYAAAEPDFFWLRLRNRTREFLARTKAWIDIHILHRKPRFLGPPVSRGKNSSAIPHGSI